MGFFDFLGREQRIKEETQNNLGTEQTFATQSSDKGPVYVCVPKSYQDVSKIIDALKSGKTPVVHLTELKESTALRILDMLSGAVYALGGGIYEMQKNVFLLSPTGVEVNV